MVWCWIVQSSTCQVFGQHAQAQHRRARCPGHRRATACLRRGGNRRPAARARSGSRHETRRSAGRSQRLPWSARTGHNAGIVPRAMADDSTSSGPLGMNANGRLRLNQRDARQQRRLQVDGARAKVGGIARHAELAGGERRLAIPGDSPQVVPVVVPVSRSEILGAHVGRQQRACLGIFGQGPTAQGVQESRGAGDVRVDALEPRAIVRRSGSAPPARRWLRPRRPTRRPVGARWRR